MSEMILGKNKIKLALGSAVNTERQILIQRSLWFIIFLASLALMFKQRDYFQIGIYKDDANYILLAKSLVTSGQYGTLSDLGNSALFEFPFGFPLILAPFVRVFQNNYEVLKIVSVIATLLNITILYWCWRWIMPGTSHWWGLAISGIYAVFPLTIRHTSMVMSEPTFTFFCLVAIILTEYSVRQKRYKNVYILVVGVILAMVFFIRTVGIALTISVVIYLLFNYKKNIVRPSIFLLSGFLTITVLTIAFTPLTISNLIPERYVSSIFQRLSGNSTINQPNVQVDLESDQLNNIALDPVSAKPVHPVRIFFRGLLFHLEEDVRDVVLPVGGGDIEKRIIERLGIIGFSKILGLLTSGFVFIGFIFALKKYGPSVYLIFASIFFLMLLFWVWEGPRLIYPIQTQLLFAFLFGIQSFLLALVSRFKGQWQSLNIANYFLVILIFLILSISTYKSFRIQNSKSNAGDLKLRTEWIAANTGSDQVILSEDPATNYLYVQRIFVGFPTHIKSTAELIAYLQDLSVNYLLIAPEINWQTEYHPILSNEMNAILPFVHQLVDEDMITLVHEDAANLVYVYQVNLSLQKTDIQ